jgi:hypothetical protein
MDPARGSVLVGVGWALVPIMYGLGLYSGWVTKTAWVRYDVRFIIIQIF